MTTPLVYLPPDVERRLILEEAGRVIELLSVPPAPHVIDGLVLPVIPPEWNVPLQFVQAAAKCLEILAATHEVKKYAIIEIWRRRDCKKCQTRAFLANPWRLCDCASIHFLEVPYGD